MVLGWLRAWWRGLVRPAHRSRGRGGLERLRVVLYTRQGCHLCDDVWALLEAQRARYGFPLEAVDVDSDAELRERYGLEVPVIVVDEKVRFRGVVSPHLLERLFRGEAGRRR
jgi:glutaredoxin